VEPAGGVEGSLANNIADAIGFVAWPSRSKPVDPIVPFRHGPVDVLKQSATAPAGAPPHPLRKNDPDALQDEFINHIEGDKATMTPFVECLLVLGAILGASVIGMWVSRMLPEHHLSDGTRTHFATAVSVVATLTALVLGLAISNANTTRLAMIQDLTLLSSNILRAGDLVREYGPEAEDAHVTLARYAALKLEDLFPQAPPRVPNLSNQATDRLLDQLQGQLVNLHPQDDLQRWRQAQALEATNQIVLKRWAIAEQAYATVPQAVVYIVTFWLAILFGTYGLFTPRHATAVMALFLSATAVAGAIFLILEARTPFSGLVIIASGSLSDAAAMVQR
jgi:hypothetical protein